MEKEIDDIIVRVLSGEVLAPEEQGLFDEWYAKEANRKQLYEWQRLQAAIRANSYGKDVRVEEGWKAFRRKVRPQIQMRVVWRYAALFLILVGFAGAYRLLTHQQAPTVVVDNTHTIISGKKQAILTLSNGEQIALSDSLPEKLEKEKGVTIRSNSSNRLVYKASEAAKGIAYNTIDVPRGGEYVLTLSDSTTVWLNSESRIVYPVAFNGSIREVELVGEAFFEVKKDAGKPFIVRMGQFDVRVTGTQFNIRNYPEEAICATLTEGRIQMEGGKQISHLLPGQQATLVNDRFEVRQVDTEETVAWRNEAFYFKQRRLEYIMNELARWYDIEIFYQNNEVRDYHFTAWFRRSTPIQKIIDILEKTQNIKLELKGKTLTIKNQHNN